MSSFNKAKSSPAAARNNVPAPVRNVASAVPNTTNLAGAPAFTTSDKSNLVSILTTSFVEDQFYAKASDTLTKLKTLIASVDSEFVAKAAIYARKEFGMRSITHAAAAILIHKERGKGLSWLKVFVDRVVHRADDMLEILAAYISMFGKPIPNSLKKGLALAFARFDRYHIAKYKSDSGAVKMVDLVRLIHPKPSEKNAEVLKELIAGTLVSTDTWESEMSALGTKQLKPAELAKEKIKVWSDLITEGKLGYFALLRNMRNIIQTDNLPLVKLACAALTNEEAIKKSLVLPFRFLVASKELELIHSECSRLGNQAIAKAMQLSLFNVPTFPGRTLIALDASGSMTTTGYQAGTGKAKSYAPADIGSLFAAVIAKANNSDILLFDSRSVYHNIPLEDSLSTVAKTLRSKCSGGATNFISIFETANKKYDRVIILSDMQAWVGYNCPLKAYRDYCARHKANPYIYCFDLAGHGTLQFKEDHVYQLSGFSDKTLDILGMLEKDKDAMISVIEKITL